MCKRLNKNKSNYMKYDVFISYSRKDYVDENENVLPDSPVKAIMEFLDKNNISYFIQFIIV